MSTTLTGTTFPALRARMGDWWYYATVMSLSDVARWITRTDQIIENDRLRDWIQRELQGKRIQDIASYLHEQPQHFFNSIVVGIHGGEPEWLPVEVRDSPVAGSSQLDEAGKGAIGLLRLSGTEKVFAIDGQHRVEGIMEAIRAHEELGSERLSVLFVAHATDESGRERTRRLFSTLNRQAKTVSKGEIVALDEDDAFAVVTRRLVEGFAPLTKHRVAFGRQTPVKRNNTTAITTILGLYDLAIALSPEGAQKGKQLRTFMARRPPDRTLDALYALQVEFWTSLVGAIPAVGEVLSADETAKACAKYRHTKGGHVLFRPVGQRAFAQAVRTLVARKHGKHGSSVAEAVAVLSGVPMDLAKPPWVGILWDESSCVMITKHVLLARDILLHWVDALTKEGSEATRASYRKLTHKRLVVRGAT